MDQPSDTGGGHPIRIVDRYAIFAPIASGGMATVYLGRRIGPGGFSRVVAVKCLHEQLARDPGFAAMFIDEARTAARVRHPNVVPTFDVVLDGNVIMLVMEYVPGEALARLQAQSRAAGDHIPVPVISRVVLDVLAGLEAAHTTTDELGHPLQLVHRDVSPQNVIVGTDGAARLIDFGVAKARGRLQSTRDGELKGKISYMAPEQLQGQVSPQSDVFAVAILLWECLTGERLFDGSNEGSTLHLVLNRAIPKPSDVRPEITPELDDVVMRGLSRDLDIRFASAGLMADALAAATAPAAARTVAQWVRRMAADRLRERAELVQSVESTPSALLGPHGLETGPLLGLSGITVTNAGDATVVERRSYLAARPPGRPRDVLVVALLVGVVCFVGAGWLMIWFWSAPEASRSVPSGTPAADSDAALDVTGPPASSASTAISLGSPPASSGSMAASADSPPASASVPPVATKVRTRHSPAATTRPPKRQGPAAPSQTTPAKPIRPGCEQPSYRDDTGITRYKVECL
jgi:serine/threonine-protein kinase